MVTPHIDDKILESEFFTDPPGDIRDPYPAYAEARRSAPVTVESRLGQNGPPIATIYSRADVSAVLRDHAAFSSSLLHEFMAPFMGQYVLIGMDEPAHARYRKLLAKALRPAALTRLADTLIGPVADELIDVFEDRGRADLVKDFTFSFPTQVIASIIGIPRDNFVQFQQWTMDIFSGATEPEAGLAASHALRGYLAEFVDARRATPEDDMISELVRAEVDGERLNEEEIYSFLLLLLPAGIETTFRSIGSLLFHLLSNPDQLAAVYKDRRLVADAIEEGLRMDSPVQTPLRTAIRDVQVGGVQIPSGAIVIPVIGSANHDLNPAEKPESFDIHRRASRHLAFGNGVHTCLGMPLAKLETKIALNKLIDRLPGLRFDDEQMRRLDAHVRGKGIRSPTALPVVWEL